MAAINFKNTGSDFSGIASIFGQSQEAYNNFLKGGQEWQDRRRKEKEARLFTEVMAGRMTPAVAQEEAQKGLINPDFEHFSELMKNKGSLEYQEAQAEAAKARAALTDTTREFLPREFDLREADTRSQIESRGIQGEVAQQNADTNALNAEVGADREARLLANDIYTQSTEEQQRYIDGIRARAEAQLSQIPPERLNDFFAEVGQSEDVSREELIALTGTSQFKLSQAATQAAFTEKLKNIEGMNLRRAQASGDPNNPLSGAVPAEEVTVKGIQELGASGQRWHISPQGEPVLVDAKAFPVPKTEMEVFGTLQAEGLFDEFGWDSRVNKNLFGSREVPGLWEKDKKDWPKEDKALLDVINDAYKVFTPEAVHTQLKNAIGTLKMYGKSNIGPKEKQEIVLSMISNIKNRVGGNYGDTKYRTRSD
jgi:hypothetical protein